MTIESLAAEVTEARNRLLTAVREQCPGVHRPRQHRDGKPRWCPHCGRGFTGEVHTNVDPEGKA